MGSERAKVALAGARGPVPFTTEVLLRVHEPRFARLDGERLPSPESLRHTFRTLVFTPDRLAVVKGGPAIRRAYVDRAAARLFPGRATAASEYAAALAQRNAALRRAAAGIADSGALDPWTGAVARHGRELVETRRATLAALAPAFAETAERLGLPAASLGYAGEPPSVKDLERRLAADLERGSTGLGPHLHDVVIAAGGRDLRAFGSQGEQRTAVLALVLAEARALEERTGSAPLVLLDDVLSELDAPRRKALSELLAAGSQTVITATSADLLPAEPTQLLVVADGAVREG
jgi:DNA replication and repair protein RecF